MPFPALVGLLLFWQGAAGSLDVLVVDGTNRPVSGVRVELKTEGAPIASTQTDENGRASFRQLKLARYELDASKDGFEPVRGRAERRSEREHLAVLVAVVSARPCARLAYREAASRATECGSHLT